MTVTEDEDRNVDTIDDPTAEPSLNGEDQRPAESASLTSAAPQRRWHRRAGSALVAAMFIGSFGLAGFLGWQLWRAHTLNAAATAAQRTAIEYAQVLTSIDSNNVDQNFATVLNGATGGFKDMYTKSSLQLRQLLIDNKATARGVVTASAIESESPTKVVVLLMVDQTVSNSALPNPRVDRTRMKMTMELTDGRWLAANVELP